MSNPTVTEVAELVEHLRAGIRILSRMAVADSPEHIAFRELGDSITANEGDVHLANWSMRKAADLLEALSFQLAAKDAEHREYVLGTERLFVASNVMMNQVWDILGEDGTREGGHNLVGRVRELSARAEAAEASLAQSVQREEAYREALRPFAEAADAAVDDSAKDEWHCWEHSVSMNVTIGDFRRAQTIFRSLPTPPQQPDPSKESGR